MAKKVKPVPAGFHTATPYLCVRDCLKAIAFYKKAFGATDNGQPLVGADGKVGHAQIQIGDSIIMLSDEVLAWGNKSPQTLGGSPVKMCLYVPDVDAAFAKAIAAGAKAEMPPVDQFYGDRSGRLSDPFGYSWMLATHVEDMTEAELKKRFDDFMKNMPSMTAKAGPSKSGKSKAGAPKKGATNTNAKSAKKG